MIVRNARRLCLVLGICGALLAHPGLAQANDNVKSEGGWGVLAATVSLLYGPLKVVYAGTGLLIGGMAWGLTGGDQEVMNAIITSCVRGDYVITPGHLRGEQRIEFLGRDPVYRRQEVVADTW
jgi:hypothetical protein